MAVKCQANPNGRLEETAAKDGGIGMRPIDGDRLMVSLADWWYSSFGQKETDESKAIKTVMDKIEQSLGEFALEKQEQSCDTCKHGRFGSEACINCRVGFPNHYEAEEES